MASCFGGNGHMGECDYFEHNGRRYCVTAEMEVCCWLPFRASDVWLREATPSGALYGGAWLTAEEAAGVAWRCYKWASVRRGLWPLAVLLIFVGAMLASFSGTMPGAISCFVIGGVVFAVWAIIFYFFRCPNASGDAKQRYIKALDRLQEQQGAEVIEGQNRPGPQYAGQLASWSMEPTANRPPHPRKPSNLAFSSVM